MGLKRVVNREIATNGFKEPFRLVIARFGDKFYDVASGKFIITYNLLRFIQSTYELHIEATYNFTYGMKDAQAAYTGNKPINISTDAREKELFFAGQEARELRDYILVARRRWSSEHYSLSFPDTVKFMATRPFLWVAHSDGVLLRVVRFPEIITTTNLKPGTYHITYNEKGIVANELSTSVSTGGSGHR